MPKQRLDGLEIGAGGQGEAGRAVPQIMQPDWWQARDGDQTPEPAGQPVRVQR